MAAHGGKFCTSVSVLFAVLYVSSSQLHDFNLQYMFGSASKTYTTMEKCTEEILVELFYIIEYLKGLIIAVWPKKCAKLSKDGELTVKRGRAFISFLNFFEAVLSDISIVW